MDEYQFGDEGGITPNPKLNKVTRQLHSQRPMKPVEVKNVAPVHFQQSPEEVTKSVEKADTELQAARDAEKAAPGFASAFDASFGGYTRDLITHLTREKINHDLDPSWDAGSVRESFRSEYGIEYWDALENTKNKAEYDQLVSNIKEEQDKGYKMSGSMLGSISGSLFDVPSLLAGGGILKAAQAASRAYNIGKYATLAGGAVAEAGVYGGAEALKQYDDVGYVHDKRFVASTMALAGALHYGIGAAVTGKSQYGAIEKPLAPERVEPTFDLNKFGLDEADSTVRQARRELADHAQNVKTELDTEDYSLLVSRRASGSLAGDSLEPPVVAKVQAAPESGKADAGAAANLGRDHVQDGNILESQGGTVFDWQDLLVRHAKAIQDKVGAKVYEWLNSPTGKVAQFTSNTLRGMASDSPVVRAMTGILGEDPTGVFRAATSGTAVDKSIYNNVMRGFYSSIHDEFKGWSKRTGYSGFLGRSTTAGEEEFDRLLRIEMEARWSSRHMTKDEQLALDTERWKSVNPEVKRAADALDKGNQWALDTMKKHNVLGAETLDDVSRGYVPRRMSGERLRDLHKLDQIKYHKVLNAMTNRLHNTIVETQRELIAMGESLPALTEARIAQLETSARAIINGMAERAIRRATGMEGTTVGMVHKAARGEIRSILESKGMDASDIERTFELIDKRLSSRTGSNRLKGRMELDLAEPVTLEGGEKFNLLDVYDNSLGKLTYGYAEEMSGRIAMARRGISSDNDFDAVLHAAMNSGASKEDLDMLKDMYAQMLGRPMQGQNQSKFVQLMTQLNPLQSLGQVGWAQATESSLAVSRLGIGAALKAIPTLAKIVVGARKGLLDGDGAAILKDWEAMNGPIGEQWRTHRPHTDTMERLNSQGELAHGVDRILKSGQHFNGFLSFMHQITEAQLKTVAVVGTRKVADEIRAGVLTKRLADMGFDESSIKAVKRNLDAHGVFEGGTLHDLRLSKWDVDSADHFMRNMERMSAQLIQRDFVGETASWMHKDFGRLMLSLRGYSVKALNKQLIRNVAIGDAVAAQSLVLGLAFSTMGYTAKMYATSAFREDRDEFLESRLSGNSLVMGAVGWMALGSIGSELVRPMVSWSGEGADEQGAIRSGGDRIVALIPGLAPANRALQVIDDAGMALGRKYNTGDSEYGAREVRRLTQFFLGNSFPVGLAVNASVDDSQ